MCIYLFFVFFFFTKAQKNNQVLLKCIPFINFFKDNNAILE